MSIKQTNIDWSQLEIYKLREVVEQAMADKLINSVLNSVKRGSVLGEIFRIKTFNNPKTTEPSTL